MEHAHGERYTRLVEGLIDTTFGFIKLGEDLNVPASLQMSSGDWHGRLRLSRDERRAMVEANPTKSSRELGEVLGVDHKTVVNDRKVLAGENSPPEPNDIAQQAESEPLAGENSPPEPVQKLTNTGPVTVAGIKFPPGGIAARDDVSEYSVQDLKRVTNELIRRATPKEAKALCQLLVHYAEEAERKMTP
jgi:hypothetical protein